MKMVIRVGLLEDTRDCEVGGISREGTGEGRVEMAKDRVGGENRFEFVEGGAAGVCKIEGNILAC